MKSNDLAPTSNVSSKVAHHEEEVEMSSKSVAGVSIAVVDQPRLKDVIKPKLTFM